MHTFLLSASAIKFLSISRKARFTIWEPLIDYVVCTIRSPYDSDFQPVLHDDTLIQIHKSDNTLTTVYELIMSYFYTLKTYSINKNIKNVMATHIPVIRNTPVENHCSMQINNIINFLNFFFVMFKNKLKNYR